LYEDDKKYQERITINLKAKLTRLKQEKKNLYRKMVNDQIDDDQMYQELRQEIDNQISEIGEQIAQLTQSTHDWVEQSSNLLELASEAKKLFLAGKKEEKYKLLESVSSNRTLKARKVHYSYKKPFDILAQTDERTDWLTTSYKLRTFALKYLGKLEKLVDFEARFRKRCSVGSRRARQFGSV
jgi:hypothetical protein